MKKLLITGFEPFGGQVINPSWESVLKLSDTIGNYQLYKMQIPTVFNRASQLVIQRVTELSADAVICVGQAGGRKAVNLEVVAINLQETNSFDNEGNAPKNTPIVKDGPVAYFCTLPVRKMLENIVCEGVNCSLSYSAGTFVCNDVLYSLLHRFSDSDKQIGFIHLPFLPEQASEGVASMTLDEMVKALEIAIKTLT